MDNNLFMVVGHYGSGKTEFSMNYAIHLARQKKTVRMADLDIANAYFRSREYKDVLAGHGISIISNNMDNRWDIDLPALNAGIKTFFEDEGSDTQYIVDVGGNPEGARVVRQYRPTALARERYEMWIVCNAYRIETQTADSMLQMKEAIEAESGLQLTGIVNNTHFVRDTQVEDIVYGDQVTREFSRLSGLPIVYTAVSRDLLEQIRWGDFAGEILPLDQLIARPDYL